MHELIHTLALIKSLNMEKIDYKDTFKPFIINSMKNYDEIDLATIQKEILKNYKFSLPMNILRDILTGLVKDNYIIKNKNLYKINTSDKIFLDNFKDPKDIDKKNNELLEDLTRFINRSTSKPITREETEKLLIEFIGKNIDPIIKSLNFQEEINTDIKMDHEKERYLCEYVNLNHKSTEKYHDTLRDLLLGSIILQTFNYQTFTQLDKEFEKIKIFLDTNMVFALLDLHYPEYINPAKELIDLIRKNKFSLFVFDFTVEEAQNYLNVCSRAPNIFKKDIRVNSVCGYIKNEREMLEEEIKILSTKIPTLLAKFDISIEPTKISLREYKPKKDLEESYKKLKPYQPEISRQHDLAVIEQIKILRSNKKFDKIEKSIAIFLTADGILSKFNYDTEHARDHTIPEVLVDRLLTSILWLRNPSIDIPLNSLIATCCRDLFIKKHVWEKFFYLVRDLKSRGEITDVEIR